MASAYGVIILLKALIANNIVVVSAWWIDSIILRLARMSWSGYSYEEFFHWMRWVPVSSGLNRSRFAFAGKSFLLAGCRWKPTRPSFVVFCDAIHFIFSWWRSRFQRSDFSWQWLLLSVNAKIHQTPCDASNWIHQEGCGRMRVN
jgi:hypothetical protein